MNADPWLAPAHLGVHGVVLADKAHNARDLMHDCRRDLLSWKRFKQGVSGSCWSISSPHNHLPFQLPGNRSVRQLGEGMEALLASDVVLASLEPGQSGQPWVEGCLEWAAPRLIRSAS